MNAHTLLITTAAYASMTYEVDVIVERDTYKRVTLFSVEVLSGKRKKIDGRGGGIQNTK